MKITYERLLVDVFQAYYDARKHKRNTHNQLSFEIDMETNLVQLARDIFARKYVISPSVCFIVEEPVKREIFAADFRDRVVHHLLFNYINPTFEKLFISDCYSCRKGLGTSYGIERLEHHARSCTNNYTQKAYVLKLDIQGYFMSINKDLLFEAVKKDIEKHLPRRSVKSPKTGRITPPPDKDLILYLCEKVIFDDPTINVRFKTPRSSWDGLPPSKSLFHAPPNTGLPIGNLTSQLFSNIYLTQLDNFVKRVLKMEHYGRYVDDFFLIHEDRQRLIYCIREIDRFLREDLKLNIHPKKVYLQELTKGVNFLGGFSKPHRRYVSKRTRGKIKKSFGELNNEISGKTKEIVRSKVNSYLGHLRNFNEFKLTRAIVKRCHRLLIYGSFSHRYRKYRLIPDITPFAELSF